MAFKDYCNNGKCDVCGKETKVVVCASSMGPISYAYCENCLNKGLEPYSGMVAYVSSAGRFPEDINEKYQNHCRNILRELGISEEQFVNDVDKAIEEENEYWKNQDCTGVNAEDFE